MILPSDTAVQFKKKQLSSFFSKEKRWTKGQAVQSYKANGYIGLFETLVSPQNPMNYEKNVLNQDTKSWHTGK